VSEKTNEKQSQDPLILDGRRAYERYKEVKEKGLLLFECIVGSTSYGTNLPTSDIDKKFIYLETLDNVLSGNCSKQINITDDYVGYELGRYLQLLGTQNPNIIELVHADEKFIEYCHPLFRDIILAEKDNFLAKPVAFSFGEYARAQIKKAQGTNKKFMNPMDKERKTLLDFCWVGHNQGSKSLTQWLTENGYPQVGPMTGEAPYHVYGCVAIDHMKNCYHLFFDKEGYEAYADAEKAKDYKKCEELIARRKYQGIEDKDGVQIKLSSVEKGIAPATTFYCNQEGYSKYCKDYREYWEWVEKRNVQRFVENSENEHNYDRKNMMHCHRLLDMCIEILSGHGVKVFRPNRDELLAIRQGNRTYQELVDWAEEKYALIQELYKTSTLPNKIEREFMDSIVLKFRKTFYGLN
jgi:hypothetical protein